MRKLAKKKKKQLFPKQYEIVISEKALDFGADVTCSLRAGWVLKKQKKRSCSCNQNGTSGQ